MRAWAIVLAIAWVGPAAAADAGDDFSNNLFSDLAPYATPVIKLRSNVMLISSVQALSAFRRAVCQTVHEPVKLLAQISVPGPRSNVGEKQ